MILLPNQVIDNLPKNRTKIITTKSNVSRLKWKIASSKKIS